MADLGGDNSLGLIWKSFWKQVWNPTIIPQNGFQSNMTDLGLVVAGNGHRWVKTVGIHRWGIPNTVQRQAVQPGLFLLRASLCPIGLGVQNFDERSGGSMDQSSQGNGHLLTHANR